MVDCVEAVEVGGRSIFHCGFAIGRGRGLRKRCVLYSSILRCEP